MKKVNFKTKSLQDNYNTIARYGEETVRQSNDTCRFSIFVYSGKYYEIDVALGEVIKISEHKNPPKYYDVLLKSKYNQINCDNCHEYRKSNGSNLCASCIDAITH